MLETQLTILDPISNQLFPSLVVSGRLCVAVVAGRPFAVRIAGPSHGRAEAVLAVDGRDTLTNKAADPSASGIVFSGAYICKGFRINESEVREFVVTALGQGLTTTERNNTAQCAGLIAAVVYSDGRTRIDRPEMLSFGGPDIRPDRLMRGGSVGVAAGQAVQSRVGSTTWTRGSELWRAVVEYDTREGWAARGINIPGISTANPWPGEQRFATPESL